MARVSQGAQLLASTVRRYCDGALQQHLDAAFQVVAISTDDADRGQQMATKVNARVVKFGYGLSLKSAREWGLYISTSRGQTSIGIEEPALFAEPGVFIVRQDGTLYYGAVQTMPFARPQFQDLLGAIDFAVAKDYPARGEYTGAL